MDNNLVVISEERLIHIIDKVVGAWMNSTKEPEDELWDQGQVAAYLSCKPKTVSNYVSSEGLSIAKRGLKKFSKNALIKWSAEREILKLERKKMKQLEKLDLARETMDNIVIPDDIFLEAQTEHPLNNR